MAGQKIEIDEDTVEIVRGYGHDIRSPYQTLTNALYLLKRKNNQQDLIEIIDIIESSTKRAVEITGNFVSYLKSGKLELSYHNINTVLSKSFEEVREIYGKELKGIEIKENIDDRIEESQMDGIQIQRVFTNLIKNSVEAMSDGGILKLETELYEEGKSTNHDGTLIVSISDTGMGLPDDFSFGYSSSEGEGPGIGLPISDRIVRAHGGFLSYKTLKGEGTEFDVTLPYVKKDIEN